MPTTSQSQPRQKAPLLGLSCFPDSAQWPGLWLWSIENCKSLSVVQHLSTAYPTSLFSPKYLCSQCTEGSKSLARCSFDLLPFGCSLCQAPALCSYLPQEVYCTRREGSSLPPPICRGTQTQQGKVNPSEKSANSGKILCSTLPQIRQSHRLIFCGSESLKRIQSINSIINNNWRGKSTT